MRLFVHFCYPDGGEEEDGVPAEAKRNQLRCRKGTEGKTRDAKNWTMQTVLMPGGRENRLSQIALRLLQSPFFWGRLRRCELWLLLEDIIAHSSRSRTRSFTAQEVKKCADMRMADVKNDKIWS